MCQSMVDIQPAATEIRRGKKEEDRKKLQGKNRMACLLHSAAIKTLGKASPKMGYRLLIKQQSNCFW